MVSYHCISQVNYEGLVHLWRTYSRIEENYNPIDFFSLDASKVALQQLEA